MTTERKPYRFTPGSKKDAVAWVPEQGYSILMASRAVDTSENNLKGYRARLGTDDRPAPGYVIQMA